MQIGEIVIDICHIVVSFISRFYFGGTTLNFFRRETEVLQWCQWGLFALILGDPPIQIKEVVHIYVAPVLLANAHINFGGSSKFLQRVKMTILGKIFYKVLS